MPDDPLQATDQRVLGRFEDRPDAVPAQGLREEFGPMRRSDDGERRGLVKQRERAVDLVPSQETGEIGAKRGGRETTRDGRGARAENEVEQADAPLPAAAVALRRLESQGEAGRVLRLG